jgi:hypothetical protein
LCLLFWRKVLPTFCPGGLWTFILLFFASWVAKIIGTSHWHPAPPPITNVSL